MTDNTNSALFWFLIAMGAFMLDSIIRAIKKSLKRADIEIEKQKIYDEDKDMNQHGKARGVLSWMTGR